MKNRIKVIDLIVYCLGLSRQEVVDCWSEQEKNQQTLQSNAIKQQENCTTVVNSEFSVDDIRSRTKLFWYAFEGGKFSPDSKAYPNCQGVVGWINPDPNAPEGKRIYVVLPEQQKLQYSDKDYETRVTDLYDGKANTRNLVEYGKKQNIEFPAAEYAYNYCKNGVKQGEAFLPAREQLERVAENRGGVKKALKLIGGTFEGWLCSSSESNSYYAWYVCSYFANVSLDTKNRLCSVSCFLAY